MEGVWEHSVNLKGLCRCDHAMICHSWGLASVEFTMMNRIGNLPSRNLVVKEEEIREP